MDPIRVLVSGAAGKVAYSLNYMISMGYAFGDKQPIILHLLETPRNFYALDGVVMELMDCAFPLLREVLPTTDPVVAFHDISAAFLCGSTPRRTAGGYDSLLATNVRIFKDQGRCLDAFARKDVKVLVLGNPCNVNAYICMEYAPSIPRENFSALSRLDQNRALSQIASQLKVQTTAVKNVIVWGNHSYTMFPDASFATVVMGKQTKRVSHLIDTETLNELYEVVRFRGDEVLSKRKKTAAVSAAKAACDCMHDWWQGTQPGQIVSMSVLSDGSYGAPKEIIFSFPVEVKNKQWSIVKGIKMDDFGKEKIDIAGKELTDQKACAMAELDKD